MIAERGDSTLVGPGRGRWRSWLPSVLVALVGGVAVAVLGRAVDSYGYVLMVVTPLVIGFAVGYGIPSDRITVVIAAFCILGAIVGGLFTLEVAGVLCGSIAAAILVGPVVLGSLTGMLLRGRVNASRRRKHRHLHIGLLFALTACGVYLEGRLTPGRPSEIVRTERVLSFDADRAWNGLVFFEEIRHAPPWLARVGLPHPMFVSGTAGGVGDVKTCVYDSGYLVKRITGFREGELLAFDVIEQRGIEDRSVRLVRGSFRFEPAGMDKTRVVLTTEYVPLLQARLVWRPFERRLARLLHEHVLFGIESEARRRSEHLLADRRP